ncbi:hypothetical protein [Massilia sp. NP310]|uniref:hypothetical protein n=1 Tax=Massilia sp. NP310 TaxID=2861282 RepID=UPI001C62ADF8|nr:hypothetical protein [Massilia sp. NP310]QYG03902.1 hypothetical protein KY496_11230 [Massilia sp. NP310]
MADDRRRRPAGGDAAQQCYTSAMRAKVKRLRERNGRLSDQQIASAIPVEGEFVVHTVAGVRIAQLQQPNNQVADPLLLLHHAELTTMHGPGMLLKGEEWPQGDQRRAYVQEWSVRFE